jgi:hypothetical protein
MGYVSDKATKATAARMEARKKVAESDKFVSDLASEEKKKKQKKTLAGALAGFKSGSSGAKKTDLSGARGASQSAAQAALSRRRKNKVYR